MKTAIVLLGLLGWSSAYPTDEINVSQLKPRDIWLDAPGPLPENFPEANETSPRIINGQNAAPGTRGFQAGVIIDGRGFCGGSLIRADFVLTAAHCVDDATELQIILGFHVFQEALRTQQVLITRSIFVHERWNINLLQNDIALVRIPFINQNNPAISILPLVAGNAPSFAGSRGTLSGWGRTSDSSNELASHLQVINLDIITNLRCRLNFLLQIIEDQHICTSGTSGNLNVGACNGDSGGPLVVDGAQVGIVSFGFVRCSAGWPSVFVRISSFRDWINRIMTNPN